MRRLRSVGRWFAALLAVAGFAGSAQAQLSPGYSGHSGIRYMGGEESWWTLRQLGDCLARSGTAASQALLATRPGTAAETAATRSLLRRYSLCLRHANRLSAPRNLIRGAVAEGLYRSTFAAPPPAQALDPEEEANRPPLPFVTDFATCFAKVRPAEVHALLTTTRLGTSDEHAAFERLAPQLGQCIPQGVTLTGVPAPQVRLALAEAIYQRAVAAAPRRQRNR